MSMRPFRIEIIPILVLLAILGFSHDLHIFFRAQQGLQTLAYKCVIVRE